jgi:hypothetical protein
VVVAIALVASDSCFDMLLRGGKFAREAKGAPAEMVRLEQTVMVAHALG